jgi:hypothetical protein
MICEHAVHHDIDLRNVNRYKLVLEVIPNALDELDVRAKQLVQPVKPDLNSALEKVE